MPDPTSRPTAVRIAVAVFVAGACAWSLTAAAGAATVPQSTTTCWGSLAHDPSGTSSGEPHLLDYSFHCDGSFTAYTIVVNRRATQLDNLDDFNPSPLVTLPDGTPSSTESLTCSGTIPSDGFNCNAGAGGAIAAWNSAAGSFDPVDPYCSAIPPGSKAGTPPEPQALVQLIVSDTTGAEDGPFTLGLKPACKPIRLKPKHTPRLKHHKA